GSIWLRFPQPDAGLVTIVINGEVREGPVSRFAFASGSKPPPVDYTDMWWNPAESGWGMAITHQFDVMFLTWYVYDDAGRPTWYVASSCGVNLEGGTCTGTLYRVTGPPVAATFDPSRVVATPVGSVVLAWLGPAVVSLEWTIGGG